QAADPALVALERAPERCQARVDLLLPLAQPLLRELQELAVARAERLVAQRLERLLEAHPRLVEDSPLLVEALLRLVEPCVRVRALAPLGRDLPPHALELGALLTELSPELVPARLELGDPDVARAARRGRARRSAWRRRPTRHKRRGTARRPRAWPQGRRFPRQCRQTALKPQGAQTLASRRSRQSPDIRLWQSAKSNFTGSAASTAASRPVISSAMRQLRERRRVSPIERLMFSMCVSIGITRREGETEGHSPRSGGSRRTIQRRQRLSRLHGPPSDGSGNRCR